MTVKWTMLAIATLAAVGCQDQLPTGAGAEGAVPLRVTAPVVGTPITTLVVTVTAADINVPLLFNLTVANGVAAGTIRIPPGLARTIAATAMDAEGDTTHDGSVTVDVRPGPNPPVVLHLAPREGQVPITITFGSYGVVVTPATATVAVGAQTLLTVAVTDADGESVVEPEVVWATSRPTVATVSSGGLVSGLAPGSATIAATYKGVAGPSAVTVTGTGTGEGEPTQLAFTVQPSATMNGAAIAPAVEVAVQDADGNTVTGAWYFVTLAITDGSGAAGAVLGGTLTRTAFNGVATFDDLTLDEAASGYTLTATATGLASATSDAFDVGPGPAAKLVFTVQPSDVDQKTSISPAVVVTVQDAHGNTVTTSTASVTLAITGGTGTAGAVLGGSPVAAVSGVAQFGSLTVDLAGTGYTLTATSLGLNSATSTTFAVRAAGIQNGGFELWPDASWLQHSSSGRALIDVSPPPFAAHGGAYVAWLGGANNESDELTQRLTMPSQGHRLRFWHLITSAEPTGQAGGSGDSVTVQINSVVVGQFDLGRGGPPADHWVSADYDVGVGVRPGQTVVVTFRAKTDASLVSSFLIDDVTIQ